MADSNFEQGKKYHVTYKLDNQKVAREFVGDYLGTRFSGKEAQFSLRPVAGTAALKFRDILNVKEVSKDTQNSTPRKVS